MPSTPFAVLLKILLAASSTDGVTLAVRLGIAQDRFYAISSGRTRPSDQEQRALLGALVTPLVDNTLLEESLGDPTGVVWTLWKAVQLSEQPQQHAKARLSIDRISLTANTRSERLLRRIAQGFGEPKADRYYEERYKAPGLTLQLKPRKHEERGTTERPPPERRFARVELEPSELRSPRASLDVFDKLDLATAVLTRVDIAVDVGLDLRAVQVVPAHDRKVHACWYFGNRGLETLYLFAPPRRIRVYDKRAQRGAGGSPRTRFEAEERDLKRAPHELAQLEDPFRRISLVQLVEDGPLTQRLLTREARLFGLPATLAALDATEREEFTQQLKPATWLPHPSEVFNVEWKRVARALMRRLRW